MNIKYTPISSLLNFIGYKLKHELKFETRFIGQQQELKSEHFPYSKNSIYYRIKPPEKKELSFSSGFTYAQDGG